MNIVASVPLTEVLPWPSSPPPTDGRCFAVCDSIETDGRFLLYTLASQAISSSQKVLWIACGPVTEKLIAVALKKMGVDVGTVSHLRDDSNNYTASGPLHVCSIPVDIATRIEDSSSFDFDEELFIKELYHLISDWMCNCGGWIIVDDISALAATLVGERLAYCFLLSLRARIKRLNNCSIFIRYSHDFELETLKDEDTTSVRPGGSRNVEWVGAGGRNGTRLDYAPWERVIPELADGIVNVEPLLSGYSREAHGRLIFVANGRGWGDRDEQRGSSSTNAHLPLVMNFSCQDTTVSAIRLQGPATT